MADVPLKGLELWACEWEDAHQSSLEYARDEINHQPVRYVTVGILLRQDDTGVTFATDVCETNTFRGTNFIPGKMVIGKPWRVGMLQPRKRKVVQKGHDDLSPRQSE